MGVDKLSISLPERLLADLDVIAEEEGLTRSAVIREAAEAYVSARSSAEYEAKRRERIDSAIAGFEGIARDWGADPKASLQYLAEIRGEGGRSPDGTGGAADE